MSPQRLSKWVGSCWSLQRQTHSSLCCTWTQPQKTIFPLEFFSKIPVIDRVLQHNPFRGKTLKMQLNRFKTAPEHFFDWKIIKLFQRKLAYNRRTYINAFSYLKLKKKNKKKTVIAYRDKTKFE